MEWIFEWMLEKIPIDAAYAQAEFRFENSASLAKNMTSFPVSIELGACLYNSAEPRKTLESFAKYGYTHISPQVSRTSVVVMRAACAISLSRMRM